MPTWRTWDQKRNVSFLDTERRATKILAVSASVNGTGILPLLPLPRLEGMYINRSICDLTRSYSVLTQVPGEEKCLFQVAQIINLLPCAVRVL